MSQPMPVREFYSFDEAEYMISHLLAAHSLPDAEEEAVNKSACEQALCGPCAFDRVNRLKFRWQTTKRTSSSVAASRVPSCSDFRASPIFSRMLAKLARSQLALKTTGKLASSKNFFEVSKLFA